jgi:hypothetical protein
MPSAAVAQDTSWYEHAIERKPKRLLTARGRPGHALNLVAPSRGYWLPSPMDSMVLLRR